MIQESLEELLLTRVHDLSVARRVVVVATEMERPVHDVEENLPLEGESPLSRFAPGGVGRDDDLSEEVVLFVLEREAHDVGRARDAEEVDVHLRDRPVGHERHGEAAPSTPLGREHETRERREALAVGREASLLVGYLDAHRGAC